MAQYYYCPKCNKMVMAVWGRFNHPDYGVRSCLVCYKCGGMVYLKELGDMVE